MKAEACRHSHLAESRHTMTSFAVLLPVAFEARSGHGGLRPEAPNPQRSTVSQNRMDDFHFARALLASVAKS